ncbi:helix-turn-helix domain-containing protein [Flavobacterium enshiense]|uniref:helix-turn-helix domain-containing protein n=1 Tax=Flavobacterium enshiense TaxID=1341165 RepID=UPI00345D4924
MRNRLTQFYFLFLVVFSQIASVNQAFSQSESKREVLYSESEKLMLSKPNEALKVGVHLLKNSDEGEDKAKINFLIAKIYTIKADYNNALIYLFDAVKLSKNTKLITEINIYKARVLRLLYLDKQSKICLDEAEKELINIKDDAAFTYCYSLIVLEKTLMDLDRQKYKLALATIESTDVKFQAGLKIAEIQLWTSIIKGKIHIGLGNYTEAQENYTVAEEILNKSNSTNYFAKSYLLLGKSTVFFNQKKHEKSLSALLEAYDISRPLENMYLDESIGNQMAINYIALNDRENYKKYTADTKKIITRIDNAEQESVNTAYNLFSQQFETNFQQAKQKSVKRFYTVLSLAVLLIFGFVVFWYRFVSKKKRLNEIIKYLEVTRKSIIIPVEKKEEGKKISIPLETEQTLLNKLKRFENSVRFTNNDISLAVLAGQFDTNTKYLSEIINKHYNVNFNTYINKLRINFIVEKLKSDPNFMNYKISYLAEVSGFSSHSSFATVFKSITGITPITFIDLLKNEREALIQKNDAYEK